jgi:ribA/ribD-fused uncharacterized protein
VLRDAYLAVPEHNRVFLLGDMDARDMPIRVLAVAVGDYPLGMPAESGGEIVTEEWRAEMLDYFRDRDVAQRKWTEETNDNDPDGPREPGSEASTIHRFGGSFEGGRGWMKLEGNAYLSNDAPIPVLIDGIEYQSATHAYWALSTPDPDAQRRIAAAKNPIEARRQGTSAPRRPRWPEQRLAAMSRVVREKFRQHPDLADRLKATGTARLVDGASSSGVFWGAGETGRNWHGRILEIVRSELLAAEADANT